MSIKEIHPYYDKYGHVRYFLSDHCWNTQNLKKFNQNKISACELITFDCGLMGMQEIEYGQVGKKERTAEQQILAVIIRPEIEPSYLLQSKGFVFCGYDLVDMPVYISAITNCGARFGQAICYETLNEYGLISTYREAVYMQLLLNEKYPDESHAYCEIVEIWRLA